MRRRLSILFPRSLEHYEQLSEVISFFDNLLAFFLGFGKGSAEAGDLFLSLFRLFTQPGAFGS